MTRPWFHLAIVTVALCLATDAVSATGTATFPNVSGQNLNGKPIDLPKDFQSPASFVYVAFAREQQAQVDSWKPFIAEARRGDPAIGEYEVPTLSRNDGLFRYFIDGGMRRGIRDTAARAATITLYIDKGPFEQSLGISSEDAIAVLLVKPDGTVLWRASGAFDPSKSQGLDAVVSSIKASAS
jgi:hypothetical protein